MSIAARLCWRAADPLTNLAAAFILLVELNPMNLVNAGFVMSFTAVLGILLMQEPISKGLGFLPQWLRQSLSVSIAAQIGVAVPVMACYQELPVLGIVWNLWVIPATGLLMGIYAVVLLLCVTPLGSLAGEAAAWLTRLYLGGIELAAKVPFSSFTTGTPGWPVWIGALILLVSLSAYVVMGRRYRILWAAVGLTLCLLGWPPRQMPATYIQFSAGQADGAVVMMGEKTLLIDTGENASDMVDYLRAANRKVNALFLSHLHMDHAGGLKELMAEEMPIDVCYIEKGARQAHVDEEALALLRSLEGKGTTVIELIPGERLTFGGITVSVLGSEKTEVKPDDVNETSMALLIEMNGKRILTAGDLPGKMEEAIAVPAHVLKVSHHGSAGSTSQRFLETVQPQIALISCEENSSLPNKRTLNRLEKSGAAVYRTDQKGAITLIVNDKGIAVQPFFP